MSKAFGAGVMFTVASGLAISMVLPSSNCSKITDILAQQSVAVVESSNQLQKDSAQAIQEAKVVKDQLEKEVSNMQNEVTNLRSEVVSLQIEKKRLSASCGKP